MMDKFEEQLNLIGALLVKNGDLPDKGIFLYTEAERGLVKAEIFKVFDHELLYVPPAHKMFIALLDLWKLAPRTKKWWTLQYFVQAGRFEASFTYERPFSKGNLIDRYTDRYKAVLRERFGNKPLRFPPPADHYE